MSKRRPGDYRSGPSAHDRDDSDYNRRSHTGWVSGSARPEPEARDTRGYYDGGDRNMQPLKLSGLSGGLQMSESPSMKFQWNNLMARQPDFPNPTANPGLRRPEFGFGNESDPYRLNADNAYGGGVGKVGGSDHPGVDPAGKYPYFPHPHAFQSPPLPNSHMGAPKVEDFRLRDHNPFMGQGDTTAFGAGPGFSTGSTEGFRGISDEFSRSREMGPPPVAFGGYSQGQIPPPNEFVGVGALPGDHTRPPSYVRPRIDGFNGGQFRPGSSTQEISLWNQHHNFLEQTQPTIPSYHQPLSQQSAPTRDFGYGGDDGLERGLEAVSFEGSLRRDGLLEGDLRSDDVATLRMCARRRKLTRAKERRRRRRKDLDDSESELSDDEDIEQFAAISGTCGEGQWNIDQNVRFGDDQYSIDHNVSFGETQMNIGRDVSYEAEHLSFHPDVIYGGHQWNAQGVRKLGYENVSPSSRPPGAMQERYAEQRHAEQFKSARRDIMSRLQHPFKSPGGIKKRLGTVKSPDSISRRLGPLKPTGHINKRLGPNVSNLNLLGSKNQDHYKSRIRETDCLSGSIQAQRGGLPKNKGKSAKEELPKGNTAKEELTKGKAAKEELRKVKPAKDELPKVKPVKEELREVKAADEELPEDSEDFMKLVDSFFLKYIKGLYECRDVKKKLMEGGSLTTKCSVCASNSEEFAGTVALAKHAFMSPIGSFRAEHLGYHKALCALLGWDSGVVENSTWVQRSLPDAEALALKEDLFIWPPVVVIHNTSIANKNPGKRVIVSVEGMEAILKAIGFGGGKTKVCCGKSENQSILVVTFKGTYSGLREAERLHNLFAENKHGRPEFQQITSHGENESLQGNEVNCLYAYLALPEDLDNFEEETTKRYWVKSKKEVQAIANRSL